MNWKTHIAVVDCIATHPARYLPASFYTNPHPQKDFAKKELDFDDEWLRLDEEEAADIAKKDFHRLVKNSFGLKEDYYFGVLPLPNSIGKPFYTDPETQKLFERYNPRVIGKEDFKKIILSVRKEVADYYKGLLTNRDNPMQWRGALEARKDLWETSLVEPYNLDDERKEIIGVFDLEYRIFDLVRLYKTIDWEQDTVVMFG
jgi:hypothetical protein